MKSISNSPEPDYTMSFQFDVIIGNPPYQNSSGDKKTGLPGSSKNLYSSFIELSVDLLKPGGSLMFVCPPGYLKTTSINRTTPIFRLFQHYNLTYLNFDCKKHFPEVSLSSITSFILKKDSNYNNTRVITEDSDEYVNLSGRNYIPLNCTNELLTRVDSLISKQKTLLFKRDDSFSIVNECIRDNTNFVVVSQISASNLEVKVNDIILNKKGKRKPVHVMKCESKEHAERIGAILKSDNTTFVNSTIRYGDANVYPGIINHLSDAV